MKRGVEKALVARADKDEPVPVLRIYSHTETVQFNPGPTPDTPIAAASLGARWLVLNEAILQEQIVFGVAYVNPKEIEPLLESAQETGLDP